MIVLGLVGNFLSSAPKITYVSTFLGHEMGYVVRYGWLKVKIEGLEALEALVSVRKKKIGLTSEPCFCPRQPPKQVLI